MDEGFAKIITFCVALAVGAVVLFYLLIAAIALVVFAATVGVGVLGLVAVKLKRPLVNPNGPVVVPMIYSLLWASVIALALLAGSAMINNYMPQRVANHFVWLRQDALLFFLQAAPVLFISARSARSKLAASNLPLASSMVCFSASMIFTIGSSVGADPTLSLIGSSLVRELWSNLTFPVVVLLALSEGGDSAGRQVYAWLLATNGNLFKLSSVLEKVLWIATIAYAIRSRFWPIRLPETIWRDSLTDMEFENIFLSVMLGAVLFGSLGSITISMGRGEMQYGGEGGFFVLLLFGIYLALAYTLYRSRKDMAS